MKGKKWISIQWWSAKKICSPLPCWNICYRSRGL